MNVSLHEFLLSSLNTSARLCLPAHRDSSSSHASLDLGPSHCMNTLGPKDFHEAAFCMPSRIPTIVMPRTSSLPSSTNFSISPKPLGKDVVSPASKAPTICREKTEALIYGTDPCSPSQSAMCSSQAGTTAGKALMSRSNIWSRVITLDTPVSFHRNNAKTLFC